MLSSNPPLLSAELLAELERLELASRKIFRGRLRGERRSTRKGQSVEFADFRSYAAGDDPRFIDWNTYARLDRLFLKLFQEEEDLHFFALVDASHSMQFGEPTKLLYAKRLAAALGFVALMHGDRVRIETLGQAAATRAPAFRGARSVWRMQQYVSAIEPEPAASLVDGVKNFLIRNPGRGIIVLASDLMDKQGYEKAIKLLLSRQMDIYVVQVLATEELRPELTGDLRLVDCEDGDTAEIMANGATIERYRKSLAAFVEEAREFCTRRGVGYVLAENQLPLEELISAYLRKRGLVRL
jgi:uncharacterized protein (DUF58 family)